MNYLKLLPFRIGQLQEKNCNAIYWTITLSRNITDAEVKCSLLYADADGGTHDLNENFSMIVPNSVLQSWGADDSTIDNFVLTYSPLFIKDTTANKI